MIFQSMIGGSSGAGFTENGNSYGNITASNSMIMSVPSGTKLILIYASPRSTDNQFMTFCTPGKEARSGYLQCEWDKSTNKMTITNKGAVILDFCYACLA